MENKETESFKVVFKVAWKTENFFSPRLKQIFRDSYLLG